MKMPGVTEAFFDAGVSEEVATSRGDAESWRYAASLWKHAARVAASGGGGSEIVRRVFIEATARAATMRDCLDQQKRSTVLLVAAATALSHDHEPGREQRLLDDAIDTVVSVILMLDAWPQGRPQ